MRHLLIVTAFVLPLSSGFATSAEDSPHKPQTLSLWNGQAPNGDGTSEEVDVRLTLHRPAKPNGTAMVICPGGGSGGLVTGGEGHGISGGEGGRRG